MKKNEGPLTTRTKDGLALRLSISFQYRLERADVAKLYSLANVYYEPLFVRNARDVLLKAAADYDAPESFFLGFFDFMVCRQRC